MSKKDYNRSVCSAKLSKRELEDLYYSLQQTNLELKKTINAQTDQNRILSTKVQRMTAQSKPTGKDCCGAAKAIIHEQRAGIEDLTKANEALADRIRKLSMQLSTAKQFLKQNPSTCYKCFYNTNNSVKIQSSASLQNKSLKSTATSATHIEREKPTTRTAGTNTLTENIADNVKKKVADAVCNENKCRTTAEQFKQKIDLLEEELAKTHAEYSSRMTQLENQVSALQSAIQHARSEQNMRVKHSLEHARELRNADADKVELETQLAMEKRKVAELEMRLKAAKLSQQVARTLEDHLSTAYMREEKQLGETSAEKCSVCSNMIVGDTSPQVLSPSSNKTPNELKVPDDKLSKSDDSGYAEHRGETKSDEKNNKSNQELSKRISEIQSQLDALKSTKAEKDTTKQETTKMIDYKEGLQDKNILPNRTGTSIFGKEGNPIKEIIAVPESTNEAMVHTEKTNKTIPTNEKLDALKRTDTPTKDNEYPYKDIYKNVTDSENSSPRYELAQAHNSSRQAVEMECPVKCECPADTKTNLGQNTLAETNNEKAHAQDSSRQAVEVNCSVKCECHVDEKANREPKTKTGTKQKKKQHESNKLTKKNGSREVQKEDRRSSIPAELKQFLAQRENSPRSLQKDVEVVQPKSIDCYKNEQPTPNTPPNDIKQDSSTITLTPKPLPTKSYDNSQQTPARLPMPSDSTTKRKISLTKRKVKAVIKRKTDAANKDRIRMNRNSVTGKNEISLLGKHENDVNDIRRPSETIGYSEADEPNSEDYKNNKLPVGDAITTNGSRRVNEHGSILREKPIGSSTPKDDKKVPNPMSHHTYTIEPDKSTTNSPVNTDHEISVMTDLPSERDDMYDRLSPGEHRTMPTSTETNTPRNGYTLTTLSEGEVPVKRRTSKSFGEVQRNGYDKDISLGEQRSSRENMEATLKVISQELARCRSLLAARPREEEKPLGEMSVESCSDCSNICVIPDDTSPQVSPLSSNKTPNELTVPDDKLPKLDDSGYAERQEVDIVEKSTKSNQELSKRISEIQSQLDALKSLKAERDTAKQKPTKKIDDNEGLRDKNILPNRTRTSIFGTGANPIKEIVPERTNEPKLYNNEETNNTIPKTEKPDGLNDTDSPTKDNKNQYKDICRNISDSDKKVDPEQNTLTETNNKSNKLSGKKDQLSSLPEEIQQHITHGTNNSRLLQKDVEVVQPKPVNYYKNEQANPNTPPDDIKQNSSTITLTPKPFATNAYDNSQQTVAPLPMRSDSTNKRKISLTKRKVKAVIKRKVDAASKDNIKVNRNKSVDGKDETGILGKHENDVKDLRRVEPSQPIEYRADVPKTEEMKLNNDKLPVGDAITTNGIRKVNEYAICENHVTLCNCFETPGSPGPHLSLFRSCSGTQYLTSFPQEGIRRCCCRDKATSLSNDMCDQLSPGEHRTMATSTETNTPRNGYTLSEGEVPVKRRTSKSVGAIQRNDYDKDNISLGSPREKVQATLLVISQELARCRSLLQGRPRESKQNTATVVDPVSLVLRKTNGKAHFDGTVAPTCLFTIHVSSVVLSDEAILRARDANLVLKWSFLHKTAMTPLAKGRVTHLDFSTQYELQMTNEFEDYMRNEDMLITICDMDYSKKPFSTCALPLRQVLLNINKKVDMSLPLKAGPHPREKESGTNHTNNDDIGVLDLWCMICK